MNQKTPEIYEQIAQLIASLPSDRLLQQAKAPAQIEEWHKARQTQILLAECWKLKWVVNDYYPLEEAVKRQEISQLKAELINSCVNEKKAGVGTLPSCLRSSDRYRCVNIPWCFHWYSQVSARSRNAFRGLGCFRYLLLSVSA
jgi:hypothetical protein